MRLNRDFYTRSTLQVARDLLGKNLVRKKGKKELIGKIVEVEAYIGPKDKGAHTFGGRMTERTKTMFLEGGHLYVYLCYGINWMLNITSNKEKKPEAVLIRALEPVSGNCKMSTNGPGKLCKWMGLDKSFDTEDLVSSDRVWLEKGIPIKNSQIMRAKRIGIDFAEEWAEKPWRFYVKDNQFLSRK